VGIRKETGVSTFRYDFTEHLKQLDPWQREVMNCRGNMVLRSGRQVGKSFVIGIKAAQYALENPKKLIMVISKTERQAGLLFAKILHNLNSIDKTQIMKGKDRPTKHLINLKNGSKIHCLPAGDTGFGIMGFTIDLLIADEAAFIPEEVWNSVVPALAITRGNIWLLSTPFIKKGYYFDCFSDPSFTAFHTSSEDCPRRDEVFLERQREKLTKAQYAQMYQGKFVDEIRQFFSAALIKQVCKLKRRHKRQGKCYLGCDVARMDRDEFTYEIIERKGDKAEHIESIVTTNVPIPESTRKIIELNTIYNFKKEYIDSGGMGITVCDLLREDNLNKRKVVEINNASRIYNKDEGKKVILKVELYNNLKCLLETGKLYLLDDDNLKESLRCIQAEHNKETGRLTIWGDYSHIVEGLIRAAWGMQDDSLNLYCY